jgi:site-specific DNA-methyltransferase (adenine-specific)
MHVQVIEGDCIAETRKIFDHGIIVDSIVTDPPYHLTSGNLSVDWGSFKTEKDKAGRKGGFMGQKWDGGGIAFRAETWATLATALKPGGYLLAFGSPRTHHRLWCAIEDAGLIIQDCIMWLYGSGFPKSKLQLKPAWEPICVAYKPGKRSLQIDECRIGPKIPQTLGGLHRGSGNTVGCYTGEHVHDDDQKGRWPANVCHDGGDEVMESFAAYGESKSRSGGSRGAAQIWGQAHGNQDRGGFDDTGTAARFFYCGKATKADRAGSTHPTVKPIKLLQWLIRLVTPPGGTVLDPFAGSGTTGAAADLEGRNAILIEREAQYVADIKRRFWCFRKNLRRRLIERCNPLDGPMYPATPLPLPSNALRPYIVGYEP